MLIRSIVERLVKVIPEDVLEDAFPKALKHRFEGEDQGSWRYA